MELSSATFHRKQLQALDNELIVQIDIVR